MVARKRKSFLAAVVSFLVLAALTQFLTYQQYLLSIRARLEKTQREADVISDKLKAALAQSLSATKTLAFLVENYGVPENFSHVAKNILESNQYVDAIELTRKGVITHVYPAEGNAGVIGYDVLGDSLRRNEALKAIEKHQMFFAGPFQLKQGGTAVVGRLPIFKDGAFAGFSVAIIKLSTLLAAAGIDHSSKDFDYQLSKVNPYTGVEEYFLDRTIPDGVAYVTVDVPDGEWKLYVVPKDQLDLIWRVIPFTFLGFMLAAGAGMFAWYYTDQPEKLKDVISQVKREMADHQEVANRSMHRLTRLYHFTSRINDMVVHATSAEDLFTKACDISVEIGEFKLAWIGMIDRNDDQIIVRCSAGDSKGYLESITPISLKRAEGPALRMIQTGRFVYCNDIATDPLMKPWAKLALDAGYRSLILLPIKTAGKIIGSLIIYADTPNRFDDKEIQLLLETTDNISFALDNFRREELRAVAEQRIQTEKMFSDSIINSLPGIFYCYNREGKFLRWNKNFEIVSGYNSKEVSMMHPLDFFQGHDRALLEQKINYVFDNGEADVMAGFRSKDGRIIPFYFNGKKVAFEGVDYLIGMGLDISDRVKAENALLERKEEVEKLSLHLQNIREEERSRIALEIHDVLGQQLTALKMDANWVRKRLGDDELVVQRISSMITLIDETIKTVRKISSELRPAILDDLGLIAALEWQGAEFERNTGTAMHFDSNKSELLLDRTLSTNVFRVYQEALTNISRHANATRVETLFLHKGDSIELIVKDNGTGFNPDAASKKNSLGLVSMRERARNFHGEVKVEKLSPHGTVVTLLVPISRENNN